MSDDKPITIHCSNCGGKNVKADAYAEWSEESQDWELCTVFDERFCDDCGHSVSTYQREATGQ